MFQLSDEERQRKLSQIASFERRELLSDEELQFLEENFVWDGVRLRIIRMTRERPFNDYLEGFIERCKICRAPRNYCCC